jgi:hypothetical protein
MRRAAKVKVAVARIPVRKSARAAFPAWIDAGERGVSFAAGKTVMPRVRDGLVLRAVARKQPARARSSSDVAGAR